MRNNAVLATFLVAIFAGALALGVTQSDKIKGFFASHEVYKTDTATVPVTASATTATTPTLEAASASTTTSTSDATTIAKEMPTATGDTTTAGGMTPVDLNKTSLNDQAPAAGDAAQKPTDATTADAAPVAATSTDTSADAAATPAADATSAVDDKTDDATKSDYKPTYTFDLKTALVNRSVGKTSAPLVIDEYFSLTCPHCAHFAAEIFPKIKTNYIDTGKVRWVYHTFPLNEPALKAEMVARCAPNDQYFKLVDLMFSNQERWAFTDQPLQNLNMLLKLGGITDDIFMACANNTDLQTALLKEVSDDAAKYKLNSTPSFVFNGGMKVFSGAGSYEGFSYDIDHALEQIKTGNVHAGDVPAKPADSQFTTPPAAHPLALPPETAPTSESK